MGLVRGRDGIFISYRREETAANAGRLYDRLSDRFGEDRVFMDIDSIAIGVDFTSAIRSAVSSCDILLVLIGREWLAISDGKGRRRIDNPDDWVRMEIETALQRDIRVVPVLVDGAVLPQADELPPSLRPLIRRQALELSHVNFRSEVTRLLTAVDEVFGAGGQSAEAPKAASRGFAMQQEAWELEFIDYSRVSALISKSTFRLSSRRGVHEITIEVRAIKDVVEVDGQHAVTTYTNKPKPYRLEALSSALGSDVTVEYTHELNAYRIKLLILKIGDQVLRYER